MNREMLESRSFWHSRRFKYWAWFVIVLVLMGGIYVYTHRSAGTGKAKAMAPAVAVETLARKDMGKQVVLSGETVPKAQVDISPKYAGRIASVNVDLGDTVSAGDVLLTQDTKDISLSILQNQAGTDQAAADAVEAAAQYGGDSTKAQSDYDNARVTYERYESLYEQGAVAQQDRDDKYRAMMEAKAALESLQNQQMAGGPAVVASKEAAAAKAQYTVEALQQQAADMAITAPVSGVIGYRAAESGEWASAGQKLLTIVDNSELYVDVQVAEQDIGVLREGMDLSVSIDSLGESFPGRISYISPALDASTRSYTVRIVLSDAGNVLRGGMFARTNVTAVQRANTLFVPKEAVGDENGKKYVYLIDGAGKAQKAYVTLGLSNDTSLELLSGVKEGDRVAVTNISRIRDGGKVEIESNGGGQNG